VVDAVTGKVRNIKTLPFNIESLITPVSLAFWIACDGGLSLSTGVLTLYTNSFTKEEVLLLISILNSKYELSAYILEVKRING
jgi:hypothetical protein